MRANVLVVDHDPSSRERMASLLRNLGHDVTTTGNAEEAMHHLYSESTCDAVVTDIAVPGMWGDEFANHARRARPDLPVILVNGNSEGIASAIESGRLVLTKPVTWTRMMDVLREVLGDSQARKDATIRQAQQHARDNVLRQRFEPERPDRERGQGAVQRRG